MNFNNLQNNELNKEKIHNDNVLTEEKENDQIDMMEKNISLLNRQKQYDKWKIKGATLFRINEKKLSEYSIHNTTSNIVNI